jgi:GNAT superfamily N-acetyltransferase
VIRIRPIDGKQEAAAALLLYLQLSILDGDVPMEPSSGYWWVAYDGALPVGFAAVSQSVRWSDTGYLCRAGVIRSHRGKGLQKRLIRVRERKARQVGWKWLITDTYSNPASSNSLISCGYRIFKPSQPWSFDSAIYWRKALK